MRKATGVTLFAVTALIAQFIFCAPAWAETIDAEQVSVEESSSVQIDVDPADESAGLTEEPGVTGENCTTCCESSAICNPCRSGTLEFHGPMAVIHQHPPGVLFLQADPDTAVVLPPSAAYARFKLDWTNNLIRELDSGIIAKYDFEMIRAEIEYHRGLAGGEVFARIPYIYRGHGFTDGIISDWHQFFGMQNDLREILPNFDYEYTIVSRDGLVFNDEGDSHGIGDLTLGYKHQIYNRSNGRDALALRGSVKAPTGDPDKATGSGNWDYSIGALYQRQVTPRLRGYLNADWVFIGEPDWSNVGYQDTPVVMLGVEYALNPRLTLSSQYRYQKNNLVIGSHQADKDPQELAIGFNHRLADNLVWTGGFNEDLNPETAPDLQVFSYFKWEF